MFLMVLFHRLPQVTKVYTVISMFVRMVLSIRHRYIYAFALQTKCLVLDIS